MNKGLFTGWKDIFAFTFKQETKQKFKKTTIGVAAVFFAVGLAISIIIALVQKSGAEKVFDLEKVHIVNNSDLTVLTTEQFAMENGQKYPTASFTEETGTSESVAKSLKDTKQDLVLLIENAGEGYKVTAIIPEGSEISEGNAKDFLSDFGNTMETSKLMSSGIPMEKLALAVSGISVNKLDAGEQEKSVGEEMVAMLLPMIIVLVLYVLVIVDGIGMGNAVSVEKTSKLMEMMLTMTRPYSLIFGKVLAMTSIAIVQTVAWLGAFVIGFFAGDMVAHSLYADFVNPLTEVFKVLRESGAGDAFSIGSVTAAFIIICISFLFYCLLAATFGSLATKTEEVPQFMVYYQLCVMIGFFGSYLIPLSEKKELLIVARIVPFSSAFLLPGDVIVGNIPVWQCFLYASLLILSTVALVLIAGKVFKNQLFHRGESILDRLKRKKK